MKNVKFYFILLIISLIPTQAYTQFITGGFPIDIEDAPYQVSIQLNGNHHCGGSILNERYILTAAHCLSGFNINNMTVDAGLTFQNSPGPNLQSFDILSSTIHPNYNASENDFDVALIEIDGTFSFNNFVQPIEFIGVNTEFADDINNTVRVSGWGWTQPGVFSPSDQLQAVDVPIISNQDADQQLDISSPNHPELTDRMIATSAVAIERQGGCHGDSGGPLVFRQNGQNDIQVGVVSWGVPQCNGGVNSPTIYARVREFSEWIDDTIWDIKIIGSVSFCNSDNYILSEIPAGSTVTWEANPSGIVSLSNTNGTSTTLTKIQNGQVELIANVNTPTGTLFVSKNILVGLPTPSITYNIEQVPNKPYIYHFNSSIVDNDSIAFEWKLYLNNNIIKTENESTFYTRLLCNQQYNIELVVSTDCGTDTDQVTLIGRCPTVRSYKLYPNPTINQVTIKSTTQPSMTKNRSNNKEKNKLYVFNQVGTIVLSKENVDLLNGQTIDVSHLQSGVYTIVITKDDKAESNHLIISK